MCRKYNNRKLCQVDGRHLLKWRTEKNKNRNLYQVGPLCQSQGFMPQITINFAVF